MVGAILSPELVRRAQTASQVVLTLPKQLLPEVAMHVTDGTAFAGKPHGRRPPISRHATAYLSGVADAAP
jgi:hypothetical protein